MTSPQTAARHLPAPPPRREHRLLQPDLRVVGKPRPKICPRTLVVGIASLVFLALFVAATAHSLLVTGQAHLDELDQQIRSEQELLEGDRLVLAERQAPERIAREARRLGMVPGDVQTWISPVAGAAPITVGTDTGDRVDQPVDEPADEPNSGVEELAAP